MKSNSRRLLAAGLLMIVSACNNCLAYERYKDDNKTSGSNCSECHGDFTGTNSPQGTVFPSDSKHIMHRSNSYMNTACDLCHSSGDDNNPFIKSSAGTANNPIGLGCSGCHVGSGLRQHHYVNGITCYGDCHVPETAPPENVKPPYYGTADTRADNPCNGIAAANTNENWSVGDFLGLDNNGDNLYDMADFACGPYKIVQVAREGSNIRISWQTAGGRKDVIQASPAVSGTYTNLSSTVTNPGTGIVTTNYVEVGGATKPARFYRLRAVLP